MDCIKIQKKRGELCMNNTFKRLLKADIITIVLLIAATASGYGVFLLPWLLNGLATDGGFLNYLIFVLSIIAVILLMTGLFSRLMAQFGRSSNAAKPRGFMEGFKGLSWLILAGAAAVVAISICYGFLAVFIHFIFKDILSLNRIKTIINVVTSILTVLVMPLFVQAVFNFLGGMKPGSGIVWAFKNIKVTYFKILIPIIPIYLAGVTLSLPIGLLAADVPGRLIRAVLLSVAGGVSLLWLLAIFDNMATETDRTI